MGKTKKRIFLPFFSVFLVFLVSMGCAKSDSGGGSSNGDNGGVKSSDKEITSFRFLHSNNPALTTDIEGTIVNTNNKISAIIPFGVNASSLKPSIVFKGASVSPINESTEDFSSGSKVYTVTAEDGSNRTYTVSALKDVNLVWTKNNEKAVNSTGGGYKIYYSASSTFDASTEVNYSYIGGALTEINLKLGYGTVYFKIKAYSALNPAGSVFSDVTNLTIPSI